MLSMENRPGHCAPNEQRYRRQSGKPALSRGKPILYSWWIMASPPSYYNPVIPLALLFTIGALWGFFFILIKTGVTGGVAPVSYVFWFSLGAGIIVLCVGLLRGEVPRLERLHLKYYVKASLARFTFANIILYTAQGKLPIGLMAVIMATTPIFTYMLSLAFRVERLIGIRVIGVLLGIGGIIDRRVDRRSPLGLSLAHAVWLVHTFV